MRHIEQFFAYARERQSVLLKRRAGDPKPWTDDPVLQQFSFCNVFREDDRTTAWFRENLRDPLKDSPHVLLATVAFRWFNRITTGKVLLDDAVGLKRGEFNKEAFKRLLPATGPYVTGAYIIKTPDGMNKVDGVCWCIDQVAKDAHHLSTRIEPGDTTLEGVWEVLRAYPYLGNFMAYEIVTDLRYTSLLDRAPDILAWACPGPGATRGLGRVASGDPKQFRYGNNRKTRERLNAMMLDILIHSHDQILWPAEWPKWEMREVEHTLCEFDKYERARLGEGRLKRKYQGNSA